MRVVLMSVHGFGFLDRSISHVVNQFYDFGIGRREHGDVAEFASQMLDNRPFGHRHSDRVAESASLKFFAGLHFFGGNFHRRVGFVQRFSHVFRNDGNGQHAVFRLDRVAFHVLHQTRLRGHVLAKSTMFKVHPGLLSRFFVLSKTASGPTTNQYHSQNFKPFHFFFSINWVTKSASHLSYGIAIVDANEASALLAAGSSWLT